MAEKITHIYESVQENTREHFARYGHVALANVYDPTAESVAADSAMLTRLHHNNRLSGQTGDVRYRPGQLTNPLSRVIDAAIQNVELLDEPAVSLMGSPIRAQVIDHRPGAVGGWHEDLGIIVTTLKGQSWLEIKGQNEDPDAAYELVPGRIVVMNPLCRLRHRGVAGHDTSRTGLAIERKR